MRHEVTIHAEGAAAPERRPLAGPTTAGGSRADGIFLAGVPPAGIRLVPVAAGIVVQAGAAGVRVAGHAVAPGSRRLLRPGERVELQRTAIALEIGPPREGGTRVAAGALLREAAAGDAPLAGPRLVVLNGPAAGERYPLSAEQTLGRGRGATIRIADCQASRVHARLRVTPEAATVEDLRSKNGLLVNGVRLDRRASPLRSGDEIAIGETLLVFEDPSPAPSAPREVPPSPAGPGPRARERRIPPHAAAAVLLALSAVALALAGS